MAIPDAQIFVGLLVVAAGLTELARRSGVPYPIVLVLAGLGLGFVPGLPTPQLDPELFFFFFLPPLVYSEALLYSTEDLKAHGTEIFLLAVGLVLLITAGVAAVAHSVMALPWAAAVVLGAVVGPTDPVSASAVIRRIGVRPRVETILEGEALVNDGTALVAYKLAIAAAGASAISLGHIAAEAVWISLGGVAIGVIVARLWRWVGRWTTVPEVQVTFSLVMPFAAYFPAEHLGVSGVLAAVTAGLLIGRRLHESAPATRLQGHGFWGVLVYLLNSTLFLLVGLTFPAVLQRLSTADWTDLIWGAGAIVVTVVALRLLWMLLLPRFVAVLQPSRGADADRREMLILGWSGMRGGVSLAAALAVPASVAGHAFPGRDQIIFTAYIVLLATLVVPGLTLGPLIRHLGLGSESRQAGATRAREHMLRAALEHIDELVANDELPDEIARRLTELYQARLDRLDPSLATADDGDMLPDSDDVVRARQGAIAAQRVALARMADRNEIDADEAREISDELDREAGSLR